MSEETVTLTKESYDELVGMIEGQEKQIALLYKQLEAEVGTEQFIERTETDIKELLNEYLWVLWPLALLVPFMIGAIYVAVAWLVTYSMPMVFVALVALLLPFMLSYIGR